MSDQPVIGVTLGDPAGIGPEVFAKVLARFQNEPQTEPLKLRIYGAPWALEQGARIAETQLNIAELSFVDIGIDRPDDFEMGRVSPVCGAIAVKAVEAAARDAIAGEIDAIMTCPIHKEAVHAAGYVDDIGHQEILGRVSGVTWTATMLMTPGLKVVHLSTHKSLLEATRYVTREPSPRGGHARVSFVQPAKQQTPHAVGRSAAVGVETARRRVVLRVLFLDLWPARLVANPILLYEEKPAVVERIGLFGRFAEVLAALDELESFGHRRVVRLRAGGAEGLEGKDRGREVWWQCGKYAANILADFINNLSVTCEDSDRDRYKRIIAKCVTAGSVSVAHRRWEAQIMPWTSGTMRIG